MGDVEERHEGEDAYEIHDLMKAAAEARPVEVGWTAVPESETVGVIRCWLGESSRVGGSLIVTRSDVAYCQHPGYADDNYRRTERVITDESIVRHARAVLARGARTRTCHDMLDCRYAIEPGRA